MSKFNIFAVLRRYERFNVIKPGFFSIKMMRFCSATLNINKTIGQMMIKN